MFFILFFFVPYRECEGAGEDQHNSSKADPSQHDGIDGAVLGVFLWWDRCGWWWFDDCRPCKNIRSIHFFLCNFCKKYLVIKYKKTQTFVKYLTHSGDQWKATPNLNGSSDFTLWMLICLTSDSQFLYIGRVERRPLLTPSGSENCMRTQLTRRVASRGLDDEKPTRCVYLCSRTKWKNMKVAYFGTSTGNTRCV